MPVFRGIVATSACAALTIPALFLAASNAEAHDAAVATDGNNLDEIFVYARKREEKLTDVPISISAFTAEALRERNIGNAYELANFTPNLQLTKNLGRRLDAPNFRGQFGPLIGGTAPNGSFFVDGVYISGSIGSTSTANLQQVEVLRGPQSAQFGRATFAGAVNYITKKPTDEFEGEVNIKAGQDGDQEIGLWASGPIIENKLYFYVGASRDQWDGEWRNDLKDYETVAGYRAAGYPETEGVAGGAGMPWGQGGFGGAQWDMNNVTGVGNGFFAADPPCIPTESSSPGPGCPYTTGDNSEIGAEQTTIATMKLTWEATENLQFNFKYERAEAEDSHHVYFFLPPRTENNCYNRELGGVKFFVPSANELIDPRAGVKSGGWICGELTDNGYTAKLNLPNFRRGVTATAPGPANFVTAPPAPFIGQREEIDRYYLDAIYDINDYQLTVRYGNNSGDSEYVRDLDRSYALGPGTTGLFEAYSQNLLDDESLEIRLDSPADQSLRWSAGYYRYNESLKQFQRNFVGFGGDSYLYASTGESATRNQAVFGSIAVDLSDDITFGFEGRYAREKAERTTSPQAPFPVPEQCTFQLGGGGVGKGTCEEVFYSFSPRATLTMALDEDSTVYAQIAEGNKPGGFNFAYFDGDTDFTDPDFDFNRDVIIQEEKATTYEIGWKTEDLLKDGGTLAANFALFYIDWKNQSINTQACIPQLEVAGGGCQNNNIVDNAGKSSVKGFEMELNWRPTDYQAYTVAYGYADAELKEYIDDEYAVLRCPWDSTDLDEGGGNVIENPVGYEGGTVGCFLSEDGSVTTPLSQASKDLRAELGDVSGNKAPRVPEHNLAFSQTYKRPFRGGDMEWFVRNDFLYESKKYTTASNLTWAPSSWVWNARIGLESETWAVTLYVDNLTNEKSPLQIQDFPLFDLSQQYWSPRLNNAPITDSPYVNQNAFQLMPRRTRNFGIVGQYRFGANR